MAIYHLHTSVGSRKGGQSAAAKHDYIHREGRYRRDPDEVAHRESGHMPEWAAADPRAYWAAADAGERANGRLFREVEFALPAELTPGQRAAAARRFARRLTDGERLPYSLAIHRGKSREPGKPDNPHCHLIISERINDGIARPAERWFKRWNRKNPERGGARKSAATHTRDWLADARLEWAATANEALRQAGREERIHDGTLEEQFWDLAEEQGWPEEATPEMEALDRRAGIHVGPQARAMERRGERTERGDLQREVEAQGRGWGRLAALERWLDLSERLLKQGRRLLERAEARFQVAGYALRQARRGRTVLDRRHRPMTYRALLDQLAPAVRLRERIREGPERPSGRRGPPAGRSRRGRGPRRRPSRGGGWSR